MSERGWGAIPLGEWGRGTIPLGERGRGEIPMSERIIIAMLVIVIAVRKCFCSTVVLGRPNPRKPFTPKGFTQVAAMPVNP